jgi:hypothetical protein
MNLAIARIEAYAKNLIYQAVERKKLAYTMFSKSSTNQLHNGSSSIL